MNTDDKLNYIMSRTPFKSEIVKDNYMVYNEMTKKENKDCIGILYKFGIQTDIIKLDDSFNVPLQYINPPKCEYFYKLEITNQIIIIKKEKKDKCDLLKSNIFISIKRGPYADESKFDLIEYSYFEHQNTSYSLYKNSFGYELNSIDIQYDKILNMKKLYSYAEEKISNILKKEKNKDNFKIQLNIVEDGTSSIELRTLTEDHIDDPQFYIVNFKVHIP